jgi:phage FluMu gp28-like protein
MSVLLPYQADWVSDKSPLKVIEKSRRIGISWATAFEAVITAAAYDRRGMDVWYTNYTEDASVEFIRDVSFWIEHLKLSTEEGGLGENELKQSVSFPSGHKIQIVTSRPRALRGKKGFMIIDEAAHHDDLRDVLVSAKATNIWKTGRIALMSTHYGEDSEFCKIISEINEGKLEGSLHKKTFDDAINEGFYRRICAMAGEDWAAENEKKWRDDWIKFYGDAADEELLCIPSSGGGAYFPRAAVDACAVEASEKSIARLSNTGGLLDDPATREGIVGAWCLGELARYMQNIPAGSLCWLGLDFARLVDLCVLVVLARDSAGRKRAALTIEMRRLPHESCLQICEHVASKITLGGGAFDAGGNGSYVAEKINEKYRSISAVQIGVQWYVDVMPKLRAAMERGGITLPNDPDTIADLAQVRLHNGIPKIGAGRRLTSSGSRHGDFAIALAMAYNASCETHEPPTFYAAGRSVVEREKPDWR